MSFDRHTVLIAMANLALDQLDDEDIIKMCPVDYGDEVTDDHLNYLWDKFYTDYDRLDDMGLYDLFLQVERAVLGQQMDEYLSGESDREPSVMNDPSKVLH